MIKILEDTQKIAAPIKGLVAKAVELISHAKAINETLQVMTYITRASNGLNCRLTFYLEVEPTSIYDSKTQNIQYLIKSIHAYLWEECHDRKKLLKY